MVKIMTDGILLAELGEDPRLEKYDTIIIDEAHERSLNIDLLMGCLKGILDKRPELRVIVTSATIDSERFSEFFDGARCAQNATTYTLVVLVCVGMFVAGLEAFHVFLLLTNRTTIELLAGRRSPASIPAAVREVAASSVLCD